MIQPFELLEIAASKYPHDTGFVCEKRVCTFSEMLDLSKALAAKFHSSGVKPRDVVSTFLPTEMDWLSTLAIFHEAAVPVSLSGVGNVSNLKVSWFIGTSYQESVSKKQSIIIDSDFQVSSSSDENLHQRTLFARPDTPMRYVMTSGTTGTPKAVIFTGGNIESRLKNLKSYWSDERPELNFMGLSTTGGFFTALASLQHGYPYIAELAVNLSALQRAKEHQVQVLAGSPAQIGQALKLIRDHQIELPDLVEVRLAGSQPSEKIVNAIHSELGVPVKSVYGSTEGGGVAVTYLSPGDDVSDAGQLISDIEIDIKNVESKYGQIRYRGPGVSPGYHASNSADVSFVDGWFYPGDFGQILDNGHLKLEGRDDEILNVGGTKINSTKIEDLAKSFEGVNDVAVCLIERLPGIQEVAIAVVITDDVNLLKLDQFLRAKMPIGHPTVFSTFQEIPRNRMGKTAREEVKNQILRDLKLS
jgi:acyl-coenzyme A synthetase/AMP-(fatty) acid ligase